jgi:hypothetical protein
MHHDMSRIVSAACSHYTDHILELPINKTLRVSQDTLYPLKLALASLTGGDRSIGTVR